MYHVVFRNRKRGDIDQAAYDAESVQMETLAREQPGYRSFKSYAADDGETVAISEWDDEASARGWGRVAEHLIAKANGRERYYDSYTLYACPDPRTHRFERRER